jgi:Tol biopolymer transport system component
MHLPPGTRMGPYEVTSQLGSGGMGEVYRARDTRLDRDVAIKILPPIFAGDPERLARFEREAKTLASLNHPNIAQIYGIEGTGLIMELVEGHDLSTRIARGALPIAEALAIARQIAEALEAAHERGIVHRDLKPANVMVRDEGTVKVLDFGLAKALDPSAGSQAELMHSPTFTSPGTQLGTILGTAAYMAPEQARGRSVDKRADIWAFGCVLFEMLTGRQAFQGESVTDLVAAIVKEDPEWKALPPETPRGVRRVLERCLRKDVRQRLHDIADARIDLEDAAADRAIEAPPAIPAQAARTPVLALAALSGLLLLATAYLGWKTLGPAAAAPAIRFAIQPPAGFEFPVDSWPAVVLSPDGSRMVVTAGPNREHLGLYGRTLDSVDLTPIPGAKNGFNPFFSPDGKWLAFTADQKLKRIPVAGGQPQVLAETEWGGGTWGPDDTIIYTPHYASGLWKLPAAGGKPEKLTEPDTKNGELGHWWPDVLPDGKHVVFTSFSTPIEKSRVMVYTIATGRQRVLVEGANFARVLSSGHLLYARANGIAGVPFDLGRAEITGPEAPVLEGVFTYFTNGMAQISVAANGTLAFVPEKEARANSEVVWLDRAGKISPALPPARRYTDMTLSPDGRRLALTIEDENRNVWVYDFDRGTLAPVTSGPASEFGPVWTPDGRRLAYAVENPVFRIFIKPPVVTAPEESLVGAEFDTVPMSFSPDGQYFVFTVASPVTHSDLWIRRMDGKDSGKALVASKYEEEDAQISPDGKWIAYTSDESGPKEAYVQAFPEPAERWQISTGGATNLRWGGDSRQLFYTSVDPSRIMSIPLTPGAAGSLSVGKPSVVYEGRFESYDLARDGRLLILRRDPAAPPASIHIVLNWFDELKSKFASK